MMDDVPKGHKPSAAVRWDTSHPCDPIGDIWKFGIAVLEAGQGDRVIPEAEGMKDKLALHKEMRDD